MPAVANVASSEAGQFPVSTKVSSPTRIPAVRAANRMNAHLRGSGSGAGADDPVKAESFHRPLTVIPERLTRSNPCGHPAYVLERTTPASSTSNAVTDGHGRIDHCAAWSSVPCGHDA